MDSQTSSPPTTANDVLALAAKYLRDNQSVPIVPEVNMNSAPMPSPLPSKESEQEKKTILETIIGKKEETPIKVQSITIKASDKENSEYDFKKISTEELSRKLLREGECVKKINPPPKGSNFFYQTHGSFNGCHSAAWHIEESPNSLLKATVLAFAYHLPLRLKPDHIFYSILAGFNVWVNEMGGHEKLAEKQLVRPEKKDITIEIEPRPDWDNVVKDLGFLLEESITNKDLLEVMKASFTTTTPVMNHVKNLTVASIMKKFVEISFTTMCGIPYITLEGTPQDWERVKVVSTALLSIADGELNWWLNDLTKSLDKMIETSKGNGSEKDWKSFLNYESSSGSHSCSGWINSFFPFVKINRKTPGFKKNEIVTDGRVEGGWSSNAIDFSNFPPSFSEESYPWRYMDRPYGTLHVTAGLIDVIQWNGEDCALEPYFGYQIGLTRDR